MLCSKNVVATFFVSAKVGEFMGKHEHHLAHSVDEELAVKADKIFAVAQGGKLLCILSLHGPLPTQILSLCPASPAEKLVMLQAAHPTFSL